MVDMYACLLFNIFYGTQYLTRIKLLSSLTDAQKRVSIPGFCMYSSTRRSGMVTHSALIDDRVRPLGDDERQLYTVLSGVTQTSASSLSSKWREPSLTIHNVEVSGPKSTRRSRKRFTS